MIILYSRVSITEQNLDLQRDALKRAGTRRSSRTRSVAARCKALAWSACAMHSDLAICLRVDRLGRTFNMHVGELVAVLIGLVRFGDGSPRRPGTVHFNERRTPHAAQQELRPRGWDRRGSAGASHSRNHERPFRNASEMSSADLRQARGAAPTPFRRGALERGLSFVVGLGPKDVVTNRPGRMDTVTAFSRRRPELKRRDHPKVRLPSPSNLPGP